jgi:hypothetical protein
MVHQQEHRKRGIERREVLSCGQFTPFGWPFKDSEFQTAPLLILAPFSRQGVENTSFRNPLIPHNRRRGISRIESRKLKGLLNPCSVYFRNRVSEHFSESLIMRLSRNDELSKRKTRPILLHSNPRRTPGLKGSRLHRPSATTGTCDNHGFDR